MKRDLFDEDELDNLSLSSDIIHAHIVMGNQQQFNTVSTSTSSSSVAAAATFGQQQGNLKGSPSSPSSLPSFTSMLLQHYKEEELEEAFKSHPLIKKQNIQGNGNNNIGNNIGNNNNQNQSNALAGPNKDATRKKKYKIFKCRHILLNATVTIARLINSGDLTNLSLFIEQVCEENCSLKTSAMVAEESGRDKIVELFSYLLLMAPDCVYEPLPSKFLKSNNTIHTVMNSTGTKIIPLTNNNPSERLYNIMKNRTHYDSHQRDPIFQRACEFERNNRDFEYFAQATWIFELNPTMTKIQKLIIHQKILDVKPPRYVPMEEGQAVEGTVDIESIDDNEEFLVL